MHIFVTTSFSCNRHIYAYSFSLLPLHHENCFFSDQQNGSHNKWQQTLVTYSHRNTHTFSLLHDPSFLT
ncbi:hypothetical protein [Rubritalea tangerina]|uniref:hypothetical protein n=1 Tax=Rubritalea tangerina TaxID=430798 RepID=UPI00362125DF